MDVDVASRVLAGSILTGLAFIVFVITVVIINNIIHKYWKPVRIFTADSWNFNPPAHFIEQEPALDARQIKTSTEVKGS